MSRRRRFDHLVTELSVALGALVPRYALWLCLRELGIDPEQLTRRQVLDFLDGPLQAFLARDGRRLSLRQARRLRRSLARYDPRRPTPEEWLSGSRARPGR